MVKLNPTRMLELQTQTSVCSVSATILKKGRPALFVSGWFAKMLTAATLVCSIVVAPKCCGYLWLPTISSETHY